MKPSSDSNRDDPARAAANASPGAIPTTGGVPPEDAAGAAGGATSDRSAAEDLVDGIDLMLRAARKALRSVDPRIEAAAEHALTRLKLLDDQATETLRRHIDPKLQTLASEVGREIAAVVDRLASQVESVLEREGR